MFLKPKGSKDLTGLKGCMCCSQSCVITDGVGSRVVGIACFLLLLSHTNPSFLKANAKCTNNCLKFVCYVVNHIHATFLFPSHRSKLVRRIIT